MRQFQEVEKFFNSLDDGVLLSYLTHLQYDILDIEQLSETVSMYTNIPDSLIIPTLESYLVSEAARRWYYNNLSIIYRDTE